MTKPDSGIRRQVYLLSAQDFADHPVWEFCGDEEGFEEQDEATVKPSGEAEINGYAPGAYVVAADATFADGTRTLGYLYSGEPHDFGCLQPNVLTPSGQVNLWLGSLQFIKDVDQRVAENLKTLGRDPSQVFPITFQSRVKVNNELLRVVVEGFMAVDTRRSLKILGR
jgi:hypothetical protein